jgi:hypothetical protein
MLQHGASTLRARWAHYLACEVILEAQRPTFASLLATVIIVMKHNDRAIVFQ